MTVIRVESSDLHAEIDAMREEDLRRRRTMKWADIDPDVLPAWVAEMDYPLAPVAAQAVHDVVARGDLGYPMADEFRAAFAEWAQRAQGWRVDTAGVQPVADVMAGIEASLRTLTRPGDGVVLLTPAYPPFLTLLAELGREVRECRLLDTTSGWQIDFDAVADALAGGARAVLLCHPHNPTGRVWSTAELGALAELADRYGAYVVSDEIHAPLLAKGQDFLPYAASGPVAASHAITLSSVSKGWNVPGLKCAVLVDQRSTPTVVEALPLHETLRASVPGMAAATALWCDDGGWLDAVRTYLDRTREALSAWARARPGVRWHVGAAGYLAWLDLREAGLGPDPAEALLTEARVKVNPGADFAPGDSLVGAGFVRLNHATSLPLLAAVLDRIDVVLERGARSG